MSLVNQMLNDLEKRGVNVSRADAAIRPVPQRRRVRWLPYALMVVVAGGAAVLWYGRSVPQQPVQAVVEPSAAQDQTRLPLVAGLAEPVSASMPVAVSAVSVAQTQEPVVVQAVPTHQARQPKPVQREVAAVELPVKVITPRQRAQSESDKANQFVREGRVDEALAAYENALLSDPTYKEARRAKVALLLSLKRNDEAEGVLQRGLKRDPHDASFAMLLARLQVERDAVQLALETLKKNLGDAKELPDYLAFYAVLLQRQAQHADAVTYFGKALALMPNNGVWLMGQGISLQTLQRKDEARAAYQRALESNTLNAQLQGYVQEKIREVQ